MIEERSFIIIARLSQLHIYILLSQTEMLAEVYQRFDKEQWLLQEVSGEDVVITLQQGELNLPLSELYRQDQCSPVRLALGINRAKSAPRKLIIDRPISIAF